MKNFRDYEALIRNRVAQENDNDPNWNWSVHSFGKDLVRIRWGYLDYCQEEDNCFILKLDAPSPAMEEDDAFITGRTPHYDMIDGHFVAEEVTHCWQESYENAIKSSLEAIFYYAHSRY